MQKSRQNFGRPGGGPHNHNKVTRSLPRTAQSYTVLIAWLCKHLYCSSLCRICIVQLHVNVPGPENGWVPLFGTEPSNGCGAASFPETQL